MSKVGSALVNHMMHRAITKERRGSGLSFFVLANVRDFRLTKQGESHIRAASRKFARPTHRSFAIPRYELVEYDVPVEMR